MIRSPVLRWLIVLALVLLSACGSETATSPKEENITTKATASQEHTTNGPPETSSASKPNEPANIEPPQEILPLTVMELVPVTDPMVSFFTLANELGVFQKNGLDVEVKASGGGAPQKIRALIAGEADIVTSDIIVSMSSVYEGGNFKVIMVPSARYGAAIIANKQFKDVADLKGHQWGVPSIGGSARFLTELVLEANGISSDDVKWLAMGGTGEALPKIFTGRVDVGTLTPSALPLLNTPEAKDVHVLIENTAAVTPPFPNFNFVAKTEFLQQNPETAYRFVKAMIEMNRIFHNEPEKYIEVVMKLMPDKYTPDDVKKLSESLNSTGYWAENGGIHLEGTQKVLDLFFTHQEKGGNEYLSEPKDVYDFQFVDKALDELGLVQNSLDQPDWRN